MSPIVADKQWSGEVNAGFSNSTNVTLVDDITTNPPLRTSVKVNTSISFWDLIMPVNLAAHLHLTLFPHIEILTDNYLVGLKWQFLTEGPWVSAVEIAAGNKIDRSSANSGASTSDANTRTTLSGISIGYKTETLGVPYLSLIYEDHRTQTSVVNPSGFFSFTDHGVHYNAALGIGNNGQTGFSAAAEIGVTGISWERGSYYPQQTIGVLIGYRW
jgi:hypothetical protein